MKGRVLDYSIQTNSGVISGDDGQRYTFSSADWRSRELPVAGMAVDFSTAGDAATDIYQDTSISAPHAPAPQSRSSGMGVRCVQCGSNVIPQSAMNWLLFIVFLLLCFPVAVIYLIVQEGKPPSCPICGSSDFENAAA